MKLNNITALYHKQLRDRFKNIQVFILFFVFPIIGIVMSTALKESGMASFFISIFGVMHCAFTPIVVTAAIIAEEKEKNTLRVLIMSNVTSLEYLLSIGSFVLIATLITGCAFFTVLPTEINPATFILALSIGSIISIILGMCLGASSKTTSSANGKAVPIGMLLSFGPMLASFNEGIEKVTRFTYGQQIVYIISDISKVTVGGVIITIANMLFFSILFIIIYRKSMLDE